MVQKELNGTYPPFAYASLASVRDVPYVVARTSSCRRRYVFVGRDNCAGIQASVQPPSVKIPWSTARRLNSLV